MLKKSVHDRFCIRRRIAVWFAVFALSLQSMVPLAQALPAAGGLGAGAYIVICTALGIQKIPDPNAPPRSDDRPTCPVCMAHALGGSLLLPLRVSPTLAKLSGSAFYTVANKEQPGGLAPLVLSNRDPPVV